MPFDFDVLETDTPSIVIAMGIVSTTNAPHHHFTVSLTQTLARDTPPGVLTVHALSLSHPNIIPPLNENMVFCGALLTVNHKDPIINLIQSDAIDNNLPEPAFLLV